MVVRDTLKFLKKPSSTATDPLNCGGIRLIPFQSSCSESAFETLIMKKDRNFCILYKFQSSFSEENYTFL